MKSNKEVRLPAVDIEQAMMEVVKDCMPRNIKFLTVEYIANDGDCAYFTHWFSVTE